jgi:acyl-coenzyme A synthetase/AMP-(fatty) acid ligase
VLGDRVVFRGRDSDVINVGGVKVDPLPVEHRITTLREVIAARVFGRRNPMTGAIVAAEIVPAEGADEERMRREIKDAVADLPRAWHPRSVRFVKAVETRGAKTVRGMQS